MKIKQFICLIFLIFSSNTFAQMMFGNTLLPDSSSFKFKYGIYLSFDEFLNNNPIITNEFNLIKSKKAFKNEYKFHIEYKDLKDSLIKLQPNKVWGFYNGFGVFLFYNEKPYQFFILGSISNIIFEKYRAQSIFSRIFGIFFNSSGYIANISSYNQGLGLFNNNVIVPGYGNMYTKGNKLYKYKFALLDLKTKEIIKRKSKKFEQLLMKIDCDLYYQYLSNRRIRRTEKIDFYINEYNKKHLITFAKTGINLSKN